MAVKTGTTFTNLPALNVGKVTRRGTTFIGISGGVVSDTVAPVISGLTPAPGQLSSRFQEIEFDVDDISPGISLVFVYLKYANKNETYMVHNGVSFILPFTGTRTSTPTGYHFELSAIGGFQNAFDLSVSAVDTDGNVVLP